MSLVECELGTEWADIASRGVAVRVRKVKESASVELLVCCCVGVELIENVEVYIERLRRHREIIHRDRGIRLYLEYLQLRLTLRSSLIRSVEKN